MSPSNSSLVSAETCVAAMIVFQVARVAVLLPLFLFVLARAVQQSRTQSGASPSSHSDVFTYHLAAMVLMFTLGWILIMLGFYLDVPHAVTAGSFLAYVMLYGETLMHSLTCAERYLAVLHPVTYRGLRGARGVRIRNVLIGGCWMLTVVWSLLTNLFSSFLSATPIICMLVLSFVTVSFLSVSVLCVLIRPGPGEGGGDKEHVDQSKQRVFKTVMTITGVLWVGILGNALPLVGYGLGGQDHIIICVLQIVGILFNLPSNLVLPMLYLHRAGKLACCCAKRETATEAKS